MDNFEDALWLASQTPIYFVIYFRATRKKTVSRFASVTNKAIIQINNEAVPE